MAFVVSVAAVGSSGGGGKWWWRFEAAARGYGGGSSDSGDGWCARGDIGVGSSKLMRCLETGAAIPRPTARPKPLPKPPQSQHHSIFRFFSPRLIL